MTTVRWRDPEGREVGIPDAAGYEALQLRERKPGWVRQLVEGGRRMPPGSVATVVSKDEQAWARMRMRTAVLWPGGTWRWVDRVNVLSEVVEPPTEYVWDDDGILRRSPDDDMTVTVTLDGIGDEVTAEAEAEPGLAGRGHPDWALSEGEDGWACQACGAESHDAELMREAGCV